MIIVPGILLISVELILRMSEKYKVDNPRLEVLFGHIAGKRAKDLIKTIIILAAVSAFVANVVFLTEFLEYTFCNTGLNMFCLPHDGYYCIIFGVYLFLCFIPSLTQFGNISIISSVITLITVVSLVIESIVTISQDKEINISNTLIASRPSYLLTFSSILIFALESLEIVFPMRDSVRSDPRQLNFRKIYFISFWFTILVYSVFGITLYLRFGDETKTVIFYNYEDDKSVLAYLQIVYTLSLFITNFMSLYPVFNSLYSLGIVKKFCHPSVS